MCIHPKCMGKHQSIESENVMPSECCGGIKTSLYNNFGMDVSHMCLIYKKHHFVTWSVSE